MRDIAPNLTLSRLVAISALCVCATCCGGGGSKSSSQPNNTIQAASAGQLVANPSAVNFGSVLTGNSPSQAVTLGNQGLAAVTINSASVTGPGFSLNAPTTPVSLDPGKSATVVVLFSPPGAGSVNGQLTLGYTGSTLTVALAGTGVTAVAHDVDLSWTASTPEVMGYNVWRSLSVAGPYTKINDGLVVFGTTYTDSTAMSGGVYYYALTAVDAEGLESAFSNPVQVSIPVP